MKDLGFSNLGFISITLIYLTFSVASAFAIPINKKLGTKWTLILSALAYASYIAAYLFPVYKSEKMERGEDVSYQLIYKDGFIKTIYLGGSVLIGIGAGPLWVS